MELVQLCRPEQQAGSGSTRSVTGDSAPPDMNASEQMYFLGAPLAHVVAYEDTLRTARCEKTIRDGSRGRRPAGFPAQLASPLPISGTGASDDA